MSRPVAFGDPELDADLAAIIGAWDVPRPRPRATAVREGPEGAGLLARLVVSQRASAATVAALAFALVAGTAFVLRDRAPEARRGEMAVVRTPPASGGAGQAVLAPVAQAAVEQPAPAQARVAEAERAEAATLEVARRAGPRAERPAAPAVAVTREVVRRAERPTERAAAVAAATPKPTPASEPKPTPATEPKPAAPVRLAMVPPPAARAAPARTEAAPAEMPAAPPVAVAEPVAETRRARRDGIDSMRGLRRQ